MAKNAKTSPTMAPINDIEASVLSKIMKSEYISIDDKVDAPTWKVTILEGDNEKVAFASLAKKAYVGCDMAPKDETEHTVWITKEGAQALALHGKPVPMADEPVAEVAPKGKVKGKAKTAKVEPVEAPKAKAKVGKSGGKKLGGSLGIGEFWLQLFRQNEAAFVKDRKNVLTDEDITAAMGAQFPGRDSKVFSDVRLVRNRMNAQTCPGVHSFLVGETFSRYVKHDGKIVRATQRGVPLNDDGTPIEAVAAKVEPVEAPKAKAKKAKEVPPVEAPVVAPAKPKAALKVKKATK